MTSIRHSPGSPSAHPAMAFRAGLYAVLALVVYGLSWYYNGQLIPLLAAESVVLMVWGLMVWWPCLRAGLIWPRGFLPLFMLSWFIWFGLTLFWSGSPYSSWFYFWVLGSLPLTFLIAIMIPELTAEVFWTWFWRGILISAWILGGMALWQYYQGLVTNIGLANLRPFGPLLDTNSFAAWLNLLFFPVLVLYFVKDSRRQVPFLQGGIDPQAFFYLLTLTLLLLAFFSTSSRGGLLAWICTMPFAVWGLWRLPAARPRFLMVAVLVSIAFLLMDYAHGYDLIGHLSPGYITSNITTVSRKLMWIATWHMYLSHPWLGTGIGSYFLNYPAYRLPGELASAGTYAHNDYLEYLAEGGLINLGFLLGFAGVLMYALYRLLYRAGRALQIMDEKRLMALGLVLGVFAITGHALGNFIFYNLPLSVLAGLFMARAWRIYGSSGNTRPLLPKIGINHGFIVQGLLLLGVCVASWNLLADGATYAFLSDNAWLNGVIRNPQQRAELLLKVADTLTALRPLATQPHVYLANTYLTLAEHDTRMGTVNRRSLVQAALHQYQQSLVGIPQQSGVLNSIGTLYLTQGKILGLDTAQRQRQTLLAWRQGLAIDPESISLRNQIAQLAYADQGDVQGGLAFLRAGLKRPLFPYPRSELLLDIALMQWRADEKPAAEKTLLRILHNNPGYAPAVSWLQAIHRRTDLHATEH